MICSSARTEEQTAVRPARGASLGANAVAVTSARLLVPALNLALVVSIARLGGAESLGRYTVLVSLFLILENVKSLGLTSMLTRDVAAGGSAGLYGYSSLVRISLAGAVLCVPVMIYGAASSQGIRPDSIWPAALMAFGLFPSAYALSNDALFLALGRANYSTLIALGENVLRLMASLTVVLIFHASVLWLAAVYAVTRLAAALAGWWVIRRRLGLHLPKAHGSATWRMLRHSPAFLTIFVAPIVLFKMDVVLLGMLGGDYEAGVYGAAVRLISVCLILPDGFMTASFAALSRLEGEGASLASRDLIEGTIRGLGAGLTMVAALGCLAARFVVVLLYGGKFSGAIPVLEVLLWSLTPFAVNRALGDGLVARGRQELLARIVLVCTSGSAALYFVLIRRFASAGAAWAFVLSVVVFCGISTICACGLLDIARAATVLRTLALGLAGLGAAVLPYSNGRSALLAAVFVIALIEFVAAVRPWASVFLRRGSQAGPATAF